MSTEHMSTIESVSQICFTIAAIRNIHRGITIFTTGLISLKKNVDALYEYMRVSASHFVSPLWFYLMNVEPFVLEANRT